MPSSPTENAYWNAGGPEVYSEADITSAIDAGIVSNDAALRLKNHILDKKASPVADEEFFRLVGGFNDIFVVIACLLLLVALGIVVNRADPQLGSLSVALVSWGLAEFFVRKKRMALTAIALLSTFCVGVFGTIYSEELRHAHFYQANIALAFAATALAALAHWKRFHVPLTVACGSGALVGLVLTLTVKFFPPLKEYASLLFFISGLCMLALAMRWDSTDTARQTRRSDVAFWLHFFAAPLLVHSIFAALGVYSHFSLAKAWVIIGLYCIIGLVSLCIDRRALMVSSLAYVIYAFSELFKEYGQIDSVFGFAALSIGAALLLLAALWQPARFALVSRLPATLAKHVPPVQR